MRWVKDCEHLYTGGNDGQYAYISTASDTPHTVYRPMMLYLGPIRAIDYCINHKA